MAVKTLPGSRTSSPAEPLEAELQAVITTAWGTMGSCLVPQREVLDQIGRTENC